jgi:glycerol-3-phosphate O-acyltransferase
MQEYISILVSDKQTVSVSVEETREKSGILVKPNPIVFDGLINSYLNGKSSDLDIIPITINYDRILEGESFPFELVGEDKVNESLTRFITSARYIGTPFGKVCINFGKKISVKEYVQKLGYNHNDVTSLNDKARSNICTSLCQHVLEKISLQTVIMSTAPLATVLLEYRKGISQEEMVKQIEYIYEELQARNAPVSERSSANRGTTAAMTLLTEFVKKKRDVFEPSVSPKVDYKNILMLAYYKNTIVHVFLKEMIIGKFS